MTGSDINLKFETAINELYSNDWLISEKNRFMQTSVNLVTGKLVDSFQDNNSDTHKILPLIQKITVANPAANIIDISIGSTIVPNYKQAVYMDNMLFTVSGKSKPNIQPAKVVIYNQQSNIYSYGNYRYPKYELVADKLILQPNFTQAPCTTLDLWYISEPITIDLNDAVTVVPYSQEMIEILIKQAMVEALNSVGQMNLAAIEQQAVNNSI